MVALQTKALTANPRKHRRMPDKETRQNENKGKGEEKKGVRRETGGQPGKRSNGLNTNPQKTRTARQRMRVGQTDQHS